MDPVSHTHTNTHARCLGCKHSATSAWQCTDAVYRLFCQCLEIRWNTQKTLWVTGTRRGWRLTDCRTAGSEWCLWSWTCLAAIAPYWPIPRTSRTNCKGTVHLWRPRITQITLLLLISLCRLIWILPPMPRSVSGKSWSAGCNINILQSYYYQNLLLRFFRFITYKKSNAEWRSVSFFQFLRFRILPSCGRMQVSNLSEGSLT